MRESVIAAVLGSVSVACVIHLWARARGGVGHKLAWTLLTLVPVLGPLFYGGFYTLPSEQAGLSESDLDLDDVDLPSFSNDPD